LREDSSIVTTKKPKTGETALVGNPADHGVPVIEERSAIPSPFCLDRLPTCLL
jgi:hypothetical protein